MSLEICGKTEAGNIRSYATVQGDQVRESRFRGEKGLGSLGGGVRVGQSFEVYKGSRNGNVGDIGSHARVNKFLIGKHKELLIFFFKRDLPDIFQF